MTVSARGVGEARARRVLQERSTGAMAVIGTARRHGVAENLGSCQPLEGRPPRVRRIPCPGSMAVGSNTTESPALALLEYRPPALDASAADRDGEPCRLLN